MHPCPRQQALSAIVCRMRPLHAEGYGIAPHRRRSARPLVHPILEDRAHTTTPTASENAGCAPCRWAFPEAATRMRHIPSDPPAAVSATSSALLTNCAVLIT